MGTHITKCIICGNDVVCCNDVHALGCGGDSGEGGCDNPPYIEFCSLEHAVELGQRVLGAIENYLRVTRES